MKKSELEDLESLYILYGKLDQLEGRLMGSLPLGKLYHPRTKMVLDFIHTRAISISRIAAGLRDYQ